MLSHNISSNDTFRHLKFDAYYDHFFTFMSRFAEQMEGVLTVHGNPLWRSSVLNPTQDET